MIVPNYKILNRKEIRELDLRAIEQYGVPSVALMENAGRSVAEYMLLQSELGMVLILCGKGNNAGDGFVIARHLDNYNIPTQVIVCPNRAVFKNDALIQLNIIEKSQITVLDYDQINLNVEIAKASSIVDALFGTGLQGIVRPPFDDIIKLINQSKATIYAVDIPSGLDCDTGEPLGVAVKAHHTITFAALKKGFTEPDAQSYIGKVSVVDIGIPKCAY